MRLGGVQRHDPGGGRAHRPVPRKHEAAAAAALWSRFDMCCEETVSDALSGPATHAELRAATWLASACHCLATGALLLWTVPNVRRSRPRQPCTIPCAHKRRAGGSWQAGQLTKGHRTWLVAPWPPSRRGGVRGSAIVRSLPGVGLGGECKICCKFTRTLQEPTRQREVRGAHFPTFLACGDRRLLYRVPARYGEARSQCFCLRSNFGRSSS